MLNKKENFNQFDANLAVEELDNETAAAIQGGADYGLVVYRDINRSDKLGSFNYGKSKLSSDANDQISSIRVNRGTWKLYASPNYSGKSITVSSKTPISEQKDLRELGFNDKISSIRQISG